MSELSERQSHSVPFVLMSCEENGANTGPKNVRNIDTVKPFVFRAADRRWSHTPTFQFQY